jgi:hypothetical protein
MKAPKQTNVQLSLAIRSTSQGIQEKNIKEQTFPYTIKVPHNPYITFAQQFMNYLITDKLGYSRQETLRNEFIVLKTFSDRYNSHHQQIADETFIIIYAL